jgi:hypothetical protein
MRQQVGLEKRKARKPQTRQQDKHSYPTKDPPIVRKVPADSVPFGDCISTNAETVWAAYDSRGTLIAAAATSAEARSKYRERKRVGVMALRQG